MRGLSEVKSIDVTVLLINKYTVAILLKNLHFLRTKNTRILLFLVTHYTIKIDIIRHYYQTLPH